MKKILTILLIGLACLSFASCNNDKESNEEIKKGDGSRFYAEFAAVGNKIFYIQHSTMHCPAIKSGTRTGEKFGWFYYEESLNTFCPKCMDDSLAAEWTRRYEEIMAAKKAKNNF